LRRFGTYFNHPQTNFMRIWITRPFVGLTLPAGIDQAGGASRTIFPKFCGGVNLAVLCGGPEGKWEVPIPMTGIGKTL
jgi:hypothetical protein